MLPLLRGVLSFAGKPLGDSKTETALLTPPDTPTSPIPSVTTQRDLLNRKPSLPTSSTKENGPTASIITDSYLFSQQLPTPPTTPFSPTLSTTKNAPTVLSTLPSPLHQKPTSSPNTQLLQVPTNTDTTSTDLISATSPGPQKHPLRKDLLTSSSVQSNTVPQYMIRCDTLYAVNPTEPDVRGGFKGFVELDEEVQQCFKDETYNVTIRSNLANAFYHEICDNVTMLSSDMVIFDVTEKTRNEQDDPPKHLRSEIERLLYLRDPLLPSLVLMKRLSLDIIYDGGEINDGFQRRRVNMVLQWPKLIKMQTGELYAIDPVYEAGYLTYSQLVYEVKATNLWKFSSSKVKKELVASFYHRIRGNPYLSVNNRVFELEVSDSANKYRPLESYSEKVQKSLEDKVKHDSKALSRVLNYADNVLVREILDTSKASVARFIHYEKQRSVLPACVILDGLFYEVANAKEKHNDGLLQFLDLSETSISILLEQKDLDVQHRLAQALYRPLQQSNKLVIETEEALSVLEIFIEDDFPRTALDELDDDMKVMIRDALIAKDEYLDPKNHKFFVRFCATHQVHDSITEINIADALNPQVEAISVIKELLPFTAFHSDCTVPRVAINVPKEKERLKNAILFNSKGSDSGLAQIKDHVFDLLRCTPFPPYIVRDNALYFTSHYHSDKTLAPSELDKLSLIASNYFNQFESDVPQKVYYEKICGTEPFVDETRQLIFNVTERSFKHAVRTDFFRKNAVNTYNKILRLLVRRDERLAYFELYIHIWYDKGRIKDVSATNMIDKIINWPRIIMMESGELYLLCPIHEHDSLTYKQLDYIVQKSRLWGSLSEEIKSKLNISSYKRVRGHPYLWVNETIGGVFELDVVKHDSSYHKLESLSPDNLKHALERSVLAESEYLHFAVIHGDMFVRRVIDFSGKHLVRNLTAKATKYYLDRKSNKHQTQSNANPPELIQEVEGTIVVVKSDKGLQVVEIVSEVDDLTEWRIQELDNNTQISILTMLMSQYKSLTPSTAANLFIRTCAFQKNNNNYTEIWLTDAWEPETQVEQIVSELLRYPHFAQKCSPIISIMSRGSEEECFKKGSPCILLYMKGSEGVRNVMKAVNNAFREECHSASEF